MLGYSHLIGQYNVVHELLLDIKPCDAFRCFSRSRTCEYWTEFIHNVLFSVVAVSIRCHRAFDNNRLVSTSLPQHFYLCTGFFLATSAVLISGVAGRTFTVYNACPFTIWPAIFTDLNVASNVPNFPTGWAAGSFTKVSFTVPDNWKAGRIWARRNCDFSSNPGPNSCLDGGCNGGLLCDPHTGTGVPPATVAEWTLQGDGNKDFYDVSLVDGYNLPMRIDNNVGCPVASCPVDLGPNCPSQLKGPFDSTGFPVGCKSACVANLDGNQANSANCCSGSHNTPATCPSSGVAFYSYFKGNCPNAYAYAFDESSGTALWTCDSAKNADYTLTFCPPP